MRHKASKGVPAAASSHGGDSIGMTILPGRPLPEWAHEPGVAEPAEPAADEVAAQLPGEAAESSTDLVGDAAEAPAEASSAAAFGQAASLQGNVPSGLPPTQEPMTRAPAAAVAAGAAGPGDRTGQDGAAPPPGAYGPPYAAQTSGYSAPVGAAAGAAYPGQVGAAVHPSSPGAYAPGAGAYPPAPSASYLTTPAGRSVPLAPTACTATGAHTGPPQAGPAEHTLAGVATVSAVGRAAPGPYGSSAIPAAPTSAPHGVVPMARPIPAPVPGPAPLAPGASADGGPAAMTGAAGAAGAASAGGSAGAAGAAAGEAAGATGAQTGMDADPTAAGVRDPHASDDQAPPQLSPEQVALLLKLADMIAKGQIPGMPAPGDTPQDPDASAAMKLSKWRLGSKKATGSAAHPTALEASAEAVATADIGTVAGTGSEPVTDDPTQARPATVGATTATLVTPEPPASALPASSGGTGTGGPSPMGAPPRPKPPTAKRGGSTKRTIVIGAGVGAVVLAGLGAAYALTSSNAPPPVPTTELTMPATVGDLELVSSETVSAELKPMVGFGLRPAGVTITGAYGPDSTGPVSLATMATTIPAPTDAPGQIATWAERTGATVTEPLVGSGAAAGITCAAVIKHPDAPTGSFCVWSGTGERGHSYVVDADPDAAIETTEEFRSALDASQAS